MTTASDRVADNLKRFRKDRGWTATRLAAECTKLGAPELSSAVIANIETGRRDTDGIRRREVTVDEMLVLAAALNVSPALFLTHLADDERPVPTVEVTPTVSAQPAALRSWMSGSGPLPHDRDDDDFLRYSAYERRDRRAAQHPAYDAVTSLLTFIRAGVVPGPEGVAPGDMPEALRQHLDRVRRYVELLVEDLEEQLEEANRG